MDSKTKQLTKLKVYIDSLSNKYHAKYTNQVRGIMYNIKRKGNLTNEELGLILGIPEERIENMLHETWDGHVSTKLVAKLQLLSCGIFGLPGCQMPKAEIDTIDDYFAKILCPVVDDSQEQTESSSGINAMDLILSIFNGDSEFQEKIRQKWGEHQAKGEEIFQEIVNRYQETKNSIQDTSGLLEASKLLSETAKTLLTKIIDETDDPSAPSQECESDDTFKDECYKIYGECLKYGEEIIKGILHKLMQTGPGTKPSDKLSGNSNEPKDAHRKVSDKPEPTTVVGESAKSASNGRKVNQVHESEGDADSQSKWFGFHKDQDGKMNHISLDIDSIKNWLSSDKPNSLDLGEIMDFLSKVVK